MTIILSDLRLSKNRALLERKQYQERENRLNNLHGERIAEFQKYLPKPINSHVEAAIAQFPTGLVYSVTSDAAKHHPSVLRRVNHLRRNVLNCSRLQEQELRATKKRYKQVFVTYTYRDDVEWHPRHITDTIKRIRDYFFRKHGERLRYMWIAEIQEKRQVRTGHHGVHYHALFWIPVSLSMPKADKQGWWPHGLTRTENPRSCVAYMAKYASKGTDSFFPKGLRIFAVGGLTDPHSRLEKAWWLLPRYVREKLPMDSGVIRAKGGGFVSRFTGEWIPAEFKYTGFDFERCIPKISRVMV